MPMLPCAIAMLLIHSAMRYQPCHYSPMRRASAMLICCRRCYDDMIAADAWPLLITLMR